MISQLVSRVISLGLGTLYPAYRSYKAVRTKNVKEYVKWMMYWVVFALFTTAETFTDVFIAFWFPFYFEIKIIMLIWLLSPTTNGSSILYRKFVHPYLMKKEDKIDSLIEEAQQQSYNTVKEMGGRALRYTSNFIMESVIRAPNMMVELVNNGQMALEHRDEAVPQDETERRRRVRRGETVDGSVAPNAPIVPVASLPPLDIDMSDVEEAEGEVVVNNNLEELTEEEVEEEAMDQFDLEESNVTSRRRKGGREAEALNFSSGDEDPDFKPPQPKKGGRSAKKKPASTPKKSTRSSKKTE